MSEWKETRLKEFISVSSGEGLPDSKMKPGQYPVYGGNGITGFHNEFLFSESRLIIGRVGALCGNVHITQKRSWITDNALVVTFLNNNQDVYFWYYILSNLNLREYAFQSAQPVITGGIIDKVRLKIPVSILEQHRIAHILTTCDSVIEQTQSAIAKYKAIKQGLLHDLFTRGLNANGNLRPSYKDAPELYKESELGMIPKEWEVKRLEEISTMKSGDGITSAFISDTGDFPVYGGNGLRGFTTTFTHEGDYVLIGRQGALCGNITRVSSKFFASEHAIVVTVNKDVDVDWLSQKLDAMNLNQYSEASAQPGLAVAKILRLFITKPQHNEQKEIGKRLLALDNKMNAEETLFQKYQSIKRGLMGDLLGGKKEVKI